LLKDCQPYGNSIPKYQTVVTETSPDMRMRKFLPIVLQIFFTFLYACEKIEYSPNQAFSETSDKDLNRKNIERLQHIKDPNDTLTIAFIGDTQRFYDECELFVGAINKRNDIDLVIIDGDISQYGLEREFEWINRAFDKLKIPYIGVIGNHDMVGNGTNIFKHTFGVLDFTFVYDSIKFVCHNTNSREYAFNGTIPNISWLQQEMISGPEIKRILPISHVPPYDTDFDKNLELLYARTLKSSEKISLSLHAHVHYFQDYYPYGNEVRYINGYAMDSRAYILVSIAGANVQASLIHY
jgi:Icc protein